ncbi:MucR family transcriptional regulator [Sphingomonas alpina]|uniref:MucR family transcriptional regulator n=1 Tax=Sphingomonas alpina TaxID=653931 RepID=A0A7H0LLA8_9SPHN|nr:MucR family transcriptional regulator [Sphingomonas alpina]QNQ10461.1 MucR family transcriptional regulator [Sphingomonas alpina]
MNNEDLLDLTAEIVGSHVANNSVSVNDLPGLITSIYDALSGLGTPIEVEAPVQAPAVSIRSSVKAESVTCLECGGVQRTLKRHLTTAHGLTPDGYRAKWNLPASYPMVAPAYSVKRSEMAKSLGLGRKPGEMAPAKRAARRKLVIVT